MPHHGSSGGCGGTLMVGLRLLGRRNDGLLQRRTRAFCGEAENRRRPCTRTKKHDGILKDRRQRRRALPPTADTFGKRGVKPRHQQEAGEADTRMLAAEGSPSQSQKLCKAEPSHAASICHARRGEFIFSRLSLDFGRERG